MSAPERMSDDELEEVVGNLRGVVVAYARVTPKEAAIDWRAIDSLEAEACRARTREVELEAQVAACLEFLSTELGWEFFRAERLYCVPDEKEKQTMSERNAEKLRAFLAETKAGPDWAVKRLRTETLEEAASMLENGRFLHDEAPTARLAKEAARAIRALKETTP